MTKQRMSSILKNIRGLPGFKPVFLFLVACLVYANTLSNAFTNWDDVALIVNNEQIRSLAPVQLASIFDFRRGGTYQPIRELSYAIDFRFWELNPVGYHIHNILLHALSAVILFLLLRKLLPRVAGSERYAVRDIQWAAFATALLFAVHPVCVESVAWLSGRKYVLLAFFSFACLFLFLTGYQASALHRWMRYGACVGLSVLALLSSPFGAALPLMLLVVVFVTAPAGRFWQTVKDRWQFLLVFGLVLLPVTAGIMWRLIPGRPGWDNFSRLAGTLLHVLFDYGRNLLVPLWLNCRYPNVTVYSLWHLKIIVVLVVLGLYAVLVLRCLRTGNKLFFLCGAWFLVFWLPASNIIPISTRMADRYIYVAFPGLVMLGCFLFLEVKQRVSLIVARKLGIIAFFCLWAVVACFSALTLSRNTVFRNSGTLWADSLKKTPDNPFAHNNLGVHLLYIEKDVQSAISHFEQAIHYSTDSTQPRENLFDAFIQVNNCAQAVRVAQELVTLGPDSSKWHSYLGNALMCIKDHEAAIIAYQKALSLNPAHKPALTSLSFLLIQKRQYEAAHQLLKTAVDKGITSVDILFNLGVIKRLQGDIPGAIDCFLQVVEKDPSDAMAHFLLGMAYQQSGLPELANLHIRTARHLDPDNPDFNQVKISKASGPVVPHVSGNTLKSSEIMEP
jgi:protein O-mannosyl-transferase